MQRRLFALFCGCILGTIIGFGIFPVHAARSSIKDIIQSQEKEFDVLEKDMYTMIYADELTRDLQKHCETALLTNAKWFVERVQSYLATKYDWISDHRVLEESWELFQAIHEAHAKTNALSDEDYCAVKYIFYDIQNWLREIHVWLLEATGLVNDFGEFQTEELYGFGVKYAMLRQKVLEYQKYKRQLWRTLKISHTNESFDGTLSDNEHAIYDLIEELFELVIYKALVDLEKDGMFSDDDIDQLEDAIVFDHQAWCGLFHGNYEVRETIDYQWRRVDMETTELDLVLNYCPNYFVLRNLEEILTQLVIHELWHHVYYYNDADTKAFEKICWSDGDTRKQSCPKQDFVSEYAMTYAVEDYADHFMHRYLKMDGYDATPTLRKKSNHFREMFE